MVVLTRAAKSADFYIKFKLEFEFNIFIFVSSSLSLSPVKIYQVFSSSENEVIDFSLSTFAVKLHIQTYVQISVIISKCHCHKPGNMCSANLH